MGQHTWFLKSKDTYNKLEIIYKELDRLEDELGDNYFENPIVIKLQKESDKLYDKNDTDYHDLFRTWKRNLFRLLYN